MELAYIRGILPALALGALSTLKLFAATLALSLPLGLPVALGSLCRFSPLRLLCRGYVWFFRGTPLLLQLFFIYFGLPAMGLRPGRETAAVLAFALNYAAYFGEIYRGAIQSIDPGQRDAAFTLGFSFFKTLGLIILPQAARRALPAVSNEVITLVKDTALVTAIGVGELLKSAKDAVNRDVDITAYFIAAAVYLLLCLLLTAISHRLEALASRHERKGANGSACA